MPWLGLKLTPTMSLRSRGDLLFKKRTTPQTCIPTYGCL